MGEILFVGATLVCLLVVYVFLLPKSQRKIKVRREDWSKIYEPMGLLRALCNGLLSAFCWVSFDAIDNAGMGVTIGAIVGIFAAATATRGGVVRMIADAGYTALGMVGAAQAVVQFATPHEGQEWMDVGQNLAVLALVLVFAVWGFGLSFLRGRIPVTAGLVLFGSLEICLYISSPLGTALLANVPSVLGSLVVATILGYGSVRWPDTVVVAAAFGTGFCVFAASLLGVSTNTVTTPGLSIVIVAAFLVPFFLARAVPGVTVRH